MGELKRKIIQFLYKILPQEELQIEKDEFDEINKESRLLKGVKGSDKIEVAKNLGRQMLM